MENVPPAQDVFPIIIVGVLIMTAMASSLIAYFNFSRRKVIQTLKDKQDLELQYQEELLHNNIITQEKERKRIAEDLHDEIGSKLNLVNLYVHQLKNTQQNTTKYEDLMETIGQTLSSTIDVSRNIAHELLPPTLDNFGLIPAIVELVESINITEQIQVELILKTDRNQLKNKWAEINLYRVFQEMFTNSIKYTKEGKVKLEIIQDNDVFQLNYKDEGPGYDPLSLTHKTGLGLRNISGRLKMIGAFWENFSKLNEGVGYRIKYTDQQ